MSRIGKKSIPLPPKVEVKINKNEVTVTGPKGTPVSYTHLTLPTTERV